MMGRRIWLLLVVAAIVSLVAVMVAYRGIRWMLWRESSLRLAPPARVIADKLVRQRPEELERGGIVFFGDSRADQWSPPPIVPVLNLGVPGATTEQLRWALEAHRELDLSGQVVVIQAGINDLKSIAYSSFPEDELVLRVVENLLSLKDAFEERGADRVVVLGVLPVGEIPYWRLPFWSAGIETARVEVNQILSRRLPQASYAPPPPDLAGRDFGDALHFTDQGYEKINQMLIERGMITR